MTRRIMIDLLLISIVLSYMGLCLSFVCLSVSFLESFPQQHSI